jgi:hypothetical protein
LFNDLPLETHIYNIYTSALNIHICEDKTILGVVSSDTNGRGIVMSLPTGRNWINPSQMQKRTVITVERGMYKAWS